jgi:chaperonin cofactor prefoldin
MRLDRLIYQRIGDILMPIDREACLDELAKKQTILEVTFQNSR